MRLAPYLVYLIDSMSGSPIYLDYAASTPLDKRVLLAMQPYFIDHFYNPSALYQSARQVHFAYEDARHQLAMSIGAKQYEVIMTAGATESINLAINGVIGQYGGTVATSRIEHTAVVESARRQDVSWINVDTRGFITESAVQAAISDETTLVSVGYVNNELGTVQPLRAIAQCIDNIRHDRMARGVKQPLLFHTDASQAAGLLDISVSRLGVDLMTLNSGKCYGPKQVGLLWARGGIELSPLIVGGGQEKSLRAGTENVAGVIGFAEALSIAVSKRNTESRRIAQLRDTLQQKLAGIDGIVINGHPKQRAPHILHISFPRLDGERAVFALDERGVMAATGSACAANKGTRSSVLKAVGMSDEMTDGSLRFSLGRFTTEEEIDRAGNSIIDVINQERGR